MQLDADRIAPGLYQGSAHSSIEAVRAAGFTVLALCAMEIQPPQAQLPGLRVLRCPIDDGEVIPAHDWRLALRTARELARARRAGQRVLVTCHQGWNRSGLVAAMTLHYLTGRDGCQCAWQVRLSRRHALSNPAFVEALCTRLPQRHRARCRA